MAELVAAGEMAQTTARTYARGLEKFLDWAAQADTARIGPQTIRAWKAHLSQEGRAPAGINVLLAGVKAFFTWAVAERGLAYNPTVGVRGAKAGGKARRHKREPLTDHEVLRVLAQPDTSTATGKRDLALLCLLAYTGARQVEVQRARLGDLRTDGQVRLDVVGKGRLDADERLYIVHQDALEALYSWLAVHPRGDDPTAPLFCGLGNRNRGGPLSLSTIRYLVTGYYRMAGIRDRRKTSHSLRHSFVNNLIRRGVAPVKIRAATRHKSLDTLMIYAGEVARDDDPAEAHVD